MGSMPVCLGNLGFPTRVQGREVHAAVQQTVGFMSPDKPTQAWRVALGRARAHRDRTAMPTAARLLVAIMIWVAVASIGALGFYLCESENEAVQASLIQAEELRAGLRHEWPDGTVSHERPPQCNPMPCPKRGGGGGHHTPQHEMGSGDMDGGGKGGGGGISGGGGGSGGAAGSGSTGAGGGSGGAAGSGSGGTGGGSGGGSTGGTGRRLAQGASYLRQLSDDSSAASYAAYAYDDSNHSWTNYTAAAENVTDQLSAMSELIDRYQDTCQQGPPTPDDRNWDGAGSLFFAFQVMTTVGYGTFVPSTGAGKMFTVFFGIVGIVVTGFVLGVLTGAIDAALEAVYHKIGHRSYHRRTHAIRFKTMLATIVLVLYLAIAAAVATLTTEDLVFGDALYMVLSPSNTLSHLLSPCPAFYHPLPPSLTLSRLLTPSLTFSHPLPPAPA